MNEAVIICIISVLLGIIAGLGNHIINRKRYYEYELQGKRERIDYLEAENRRFERANSELLLLVSYEESLPPDCTPGEYCGACLFAKGMYIYEGHGAYQMYYHCSKAGTCRNFVEKGIGE